jgi:hypothetical protein
MVADNRLETSAVWESQRLSRPDGEYVVRVVDRGLARSAPEAEVAASGGLPGLAAVVVSSLLRALFRVAGQRRFSVRLVQLVPVDSRSSEERIVSAVDVRGERKALERARCLVGDQTRPAEKP